jgi:hypothetical protein
LAAAKYITASCIISKQTVYKNGKIVFADKSSALPDFFNELYKSLDITYARFYKMDSLNKLGWLAAEVLLKDSFNRENYLPEDIGIILSNANASLDTDQRYLASVADGASPSLFVYTLPNIVTGEICIRNNFKGEDAFFLSDNFDVEFTESYVSNLLDDQVLQVCICGWVELLGNEYKAALFLVEKVNNADAVPFTKEYLLKLFEDK